MADGSVQPIGISILAKAPIAGLAKTRLIPALGAVGAARLQRHLTLGALHTACEAELGPVTLWCTPDGEHRFFRALRRRFAIDCRVQPAGDLGTRMHAAFEAQCTRGPLLLIGTDCPVLTADHLRRAAQSLLDGDDAVFYPAEDGGYVLVGLRRPQAGLFSEMTWSTATVMADTRARARRLDLTLREHEPLWDIDEPADLMRWQTQNPSSATEWPSL